MGVGGSRPGLAFAPDDEPSDDAAGDRAWFLVLLDSCRGSNRLDVDSAMLAESLVGSAVPLPVPYAARLRLAAGSTFGDAARRLLELDPGRALLRAATSR
jgi:hypothetical protein